MQKIEDEAPLITGAGRGIVFAKEGVKVGLIGRTHETWRRQRNWVSMVLRSQSLQQM